MTTKPAANGCLLCGSGKAVVLLEKSTVVRGVDRVRVLRCTSCGHRYLADWQRTLAMGLYDYYADRLEWPRERVFDDLTTERYQSLVGEFERRVPGRRLLDVGCGMGHLVSVASHRGWRARGLDTSRAAVELAHRMESNVEELDFFSHTLDAERFDVVAMTEVIEHVPMPMRFLRRAFELLTPGGILYLTTPNFDSLTRRVAGASWPPIHPEHISYFVDGTLARAARDAGLYIQRLGSRNASPRVILDAIRPRRVGGNVAETTAAAAASPQADPTQTLRRQIRESSSLAALARVANVALDLIHAGDTLILWAQRAPT